MIFHCELEGPVAHVGKQALRAMQRLVENGAPNAHAEWIKHGDWVRMGRPKFLERTLGPDARTGLPVYHYFVNRPIAVVAAPQIPAFKHVVEKAKWLWQHLPTDVQKHSHLVVARENRRNCWRRSATNPRKWGWQASKKPKTSKSIWTAAPSTWGLDDFGDITQSTSNVPAPTNGQMSDLVVATMPSSPADVAYVPVPEHNKYDSPPVATDSAVGHKIALEVAAKVQQAKEAHGLSYKRAPITKNAPRKAKIALEEKPEKPRLRIGVWA